MRRILGTAIIAALSVATALAGDLTITFKNGGKHNEGISHQYMTADRHRTNHEGTQIDSMMDLQKGMIYTIKHKDKKVEFMSFDDMEKVAEAMSARMAEMQAQMKEGPMAEMMAKMMGDPNNFSVDQVGSETVAGRKCTKYHMVMMKMDMTLSADPNLKLPMNPANFARFTKFTHLMQFAASPAAAKMATEMAKIKGFTLKSVTVAPFIGEITREATEVKEGPIPASVFALPEGYKMEDAGKKMLEQAQKGSRKR
ncbi:MAG TPA: DUF4412 domain-containing protein [Holophagaceae bacterium]|nr:DUF4412 domain-containing protein [Holophagaceae bacterium]